MLHQLEQYHRENAERSEARSLSFEHPENMDGTLGQVNSVNQLTDISPSDWAFQAVKNMVERYQCLEGYPDQTFRGNRPVTRFEFAAALNACLNRILEITGQGGELPVEDFATLERLLAEFRADLNVLRGRVDDLEARAAQLEASQFSATTKLVGEVVFNIADTFGDEDPTETVFQERIRLQLVSSFTGKDQLITRLTTGSIGNSFQDELGTAEGRFAYDGIGDNEIELDRLHYIFPVGKDLRVTIMASLGGHHFYADTFNPRLEAGGGANGALSRFGERNPIYRFGLGGQGLGLRYQLGKHFEVTGGYLARGGTIPDEEAGLFNGNYSALGQLTWRPSNNFRVGLTYLNSYDVETGRRFAFGGTGTNLGNLSLGSLGIPNTPVSSNAYGVETTIQVNPDFNISGWFGYTQARLIGLGDADVLTYAVALTFPNLLKEGSLGAIIVGAEPYLEDLDVPGDPEFSDDVPLHVEGFYKFQINDNISITPGFIWLLAPNQDNDNNDAVIGTLRTTFTF
ncbi:MAG: iron uptake porin [Coleofasciculaceae cyanobacterium SM2_3_26]|nr:iron uptake porin [Coleofasciculaceae cyanobacterium SM2_3_26]